MVHLVALSVRERAEQQENDAHPLRHAGPPM
jgi:hypothetical protein